MRSQMTYSFSLIFLCYKNKPQTNKFEIVQNAFEKPKPIPQYDLKFGNKLEFNKYYSNSPILAVFIQ